MKKVDLHEVTAASAGGRKKMKQDQRLGEDLLSRRDSSGTRDRLVGGGVHPTAPARGRLKRGDDKLSGAKNTYLKHRHPGVKTLTPMSDDRQRVPKMPADVKQSSVVAKGGNKVLDERLAFTRSNKKLNSSQIPEGKLTISQIIFVCNKS